MLEGFLAVVAEELGENLAPGVLDQEAELGVLDQAGVLPLEDFVQLVDHLGLVHHQLLEHGIRSAYRVGSRALPPSGTSGIVDASAVRGPPWYAPPARRERG
jgi:hypothetical protein